MRVLLVSFTLTFVALGISTRDGARVGASGAPGSIVTVAGGGVGDGGSPTNAALYFPHGVAVDSAGNVYIADEGDCRVRKVSGGTITTIAGTGLCTYAGDGGPAASAAVNHPKGVALDGSGGLYIADYFNCRVREVVGGTITTVAGTGTCTYGGDGGPATSAALLHPSGVALDMSGNLYIADTANCRVRKVSGSTITTVAGNGTCTYGGDGGPASAAALNEPVGLVLDGVGNLYIADTLNCRVREVSGGTISTVAGTGACGNSGDGGPATSAALRQPYSVTLDSTGNLYVADTLNNMVREVSAGTIIRVAGTGASGYGGDGGPATSAQLFGPSGVVVDNASHVYIADNGNCRVREVSGGTITTMAGTGSCGRYGGDGGPATSAALGNVSHVALDGANNLYIADNLNCRVREVSGGTITTVAGTGTCGYGGDGGPAASAQLNHPNGVALDGAGNLYIADTFNCRVREVSGGNITTVAGTGTCGYAGDGGPATSGVLGYLNGVGLDGSGNLYLADTSNCRVREVSGGAITTLAGTGTCGSAGDGGPATSAQLNNPNAVEPHGASVYIADTTGCRVRKVSGGTITTVAGWGNCGFFGDGGPATSASLSAADVALDGAGNLYIADEANCRIRVVHGGTITTFAGDGACAYAGDGGAASSASLNHPLGVAVDSSGDVYIADTQNYRIREVFPTAPAGVGGIAEEPILATIPNTTERHHSSAWWTLLMGAAISVLIMAGVALATRRVARSREP